MEEEKYIFISYSRDDLPKITPIVEEMRKNGYNVWNDAKIRPGEDWSDYIAAHIKNCAVCVAFHSQTSRDSQHCREEIHYALKHVKTVISVYLEDVTLKEGLDMQLVRFQSVQYAQPAELLEMLRKNPDFERCGENAADALPKRNDANVKTILKKAARRILVGLQFFFYKVLFPLGAVFSLIAILVVIEVYGKKTSYWFLDDCGILDVISPPFIQTEMTDYSYEPDSDEREYLPPPWAAQTRRIKCAAIRKGVTHIGDASFQNCSNMEYVLISEGVTSIGKESFSGCIELKELEFPSSVTYIGDYAFSGCTGLKSVFFPKNVTDIGEGAFSDCASLKQAQFSERIQEIWTEAFMNCAALEEITLPGSIRAIQSDAFSHCSNLKTVHIQFDPEKVQVVEDWGFIADPDTLYIHATAFDPDTEIIYEPPVTDADVSGND